MSQYQSTFINLAIAAQALKFGEFTLKSGRLSPYFFNVGQLNTGHALKTLGECYASALMSMNIPFDGLFGPAYKGIPLVCATAIGLAAQHQKVYPFSFNRKEEKDHGEGGNIIGAPLKGRIVIIDDVITKGTAIREAFDIIEQSDATVAGILVALDRQEKGQSERSALAEIEHEFKVPVGAIITLADIMDHINQDAAFAQFKDAMHNYRKTYGV